MVCISGHLHATSVGIQECREKRSAPFQEIPICLIPVKGFGDVLGKYKAKNCCTCGVFPLVESEIFIPIYETKAAGVKTPPPAIVPNLLSIYVLFACAGAI